MTIKNAKQCLREEVIPALRERSPYFDVASIKHLLTEKDVHVERETLSRYVYELGSESQIYNAGRGWYSAIEQEFRLNSEPVAEIISTLEKKFSLLDFSCWSTMLTGGSGRCSIIQQLNTVSLILFCDGISLTINPAFTPHLNH